MRPSRLVSESAARRKSPWNLLLFALVVLALLGAMYIAVAALVGLHQMIHPGQTLRGASGAGPGVAMIAAFIACLPMALLTANAVVYLIKPARAALNREAVGHAGADFVSSQRALLKFATVLVPVAVAVAVAGAAMSWGVA